jgi:hypothetical protein
MGFQMSGDVSDESAKSIGKNLGAGAIVTGSVTDLGGFYGLTLKAIGVEQAKVAASVPADVTKDNRILTLMASSGGSAAPVRPTPARNPATAAQPAAPGATYKIGQKGPAGGLVFYDNNPAPVSQAAPTTGTYTVGQNGPAGGLTFYDNEPKAVLASAPVNTSLVYKVGDRGPAGGVIFYIKPSATDGWRYLEAAPASTEWKDIAWSSSKSSVKGTNVDIGTGKQNTQVIVTHSLNTGESCRAAMLCDNFTSGGYDDWFLPSKGELNLMFVYLQEAGIGGFKADWYWSSSESGDNNGAWAQRFSDGVQEGIGWSNGSKNYGRFVRAIRQF